MTEQENENSGVGIITTTPNTDTILLGSQNTLVMINAEKLVILVTDQFWYGPADK